MGNWVGADRQRLVLVAGCAALAILGSGCSSGGEPGRATHPVQDHRGGRITVSWVRALELADRMLSRLALPPGARPVPDSALPVSQRWQRAEPPMAEVLRAYRLPQPVPQAFKYVLSHPPPGTLPGVISNVRLTGPTERAVTYLLRAEPPGVFVTQLVVLVGARQGGGSWLTTEAHVAVYQLSSAAERLDPAALRVVTISVTALDPQAHTATRVIRSAAVAARLARLINQMPPQLIYTSTPHTCPLLDVFYQIDFAPSAGATPAATVSVDLCGIEGVNVRGVPGGPREDRGAKLFKAVSQLLRT
jgi:hypothetical protein